VYHKQNMGTSCGDEVFWIEEKNRSSHLFKKY